MADRAQLTPERFAELRRITEAATDAIERALFNNNTDAVRSAERGLRVLLDTLATQADEIERLRRVVDQVEWVEPPDPHPDLGRWCPACRAWESDGHEVHCPYYGGQVNGILADAFDALPDALGKLDEEADVT